MASHMIEKVAKAICKAAGIPPDEAVGPLSDAEMWSLYVEEARAAIGAMREPTDDMLVEMEEAAHALSCFKPREESPSYLAWQAAIATALSEQEGGGRG